MVLIGASYLFGSLPSAIALARISGLDPSQEKDLHLALWRKAGKTLGSLAIFIDFIKGIIPVLVGFGFNLPLVVVASAGVAAVAGQMWPIFHNFDGEKGNTTGIAVIATLALANKAYLILFFFIPIAIGAAMRFFFAIFSSKEPFFKRIEFPESAHWVVLSFPVSCLAGFATAPIVSWCSSQPIEMTLSFLALFLVIVLRRLTAGLRADLKRNDSVAKMLINRFLFDRSYLGRDKN